MVKSITFDGVSGFITDRIPEPSMPDVRRVRDKGEQTAIMRRYKKEHQKWKAHKDEYSNPMLVRNLLGRKICFSGKIDLIFGPNGSGKTTVLNAIAGNAGVQDEFASLNGPLDMATESNFGMPLGDGEQYHVDFPKYLSKLMKNSAVVEWDGTPVYYDKSYNISTSSGKSSLWGSFGEKLIYEVVSKAWSSGEKNSYLLRRVAAAIEAPTSYAKLFSRYLEGDGTYKISHMNDVWQTAYKTQLDYYLGFPMSFTDAPVTLLLDEPDRNMDILSTYMLYSKVLPALHEKTGVQIIAVTHSPIILSEKIRGNICNVLSMDDKYTEACTNMMNDLFCHE